MIDPGVEKQTLRKVLLKVSTSNQRKLVHYMQIHVDSLGGYR